MRLFWFFVFAICFYIVSQENLYSEIPFGNWNTHMLFNYIGWLVFNLYFLGCSIIYFFLSILEDKIWPWRWSNSYLISILLKTLAIGVLWILTYLFFAYLLPTRYYGDFRDILLPLLIISLSVGYTLFIMYMSEEKIWVTINDFTRFKIKSRINNDHNNI